MMVQLATVRVVERILQEKAVGLGLTIADLRAMYPAKQVRRAALVESLRHLEANRVVAWHGSRVRWVGPRPPEVAPLGIDPEGLRSDMGLAPQQRVTVLARLCNEMGQPG